MAKISRSETKQAWIAADNRANDAAKQLTKAINTRQPQHKINELIEAYKTAECAAEDAHRNFLKEQG